MINRLCSGQFVRGRLFRRASRVWLAALEQIAVQYVAEIVQARLCSQYISAIRHASS